mmetsp:Transcript_38897/g.91600  ORF Transcript_38897/g.91600 Transcript_38897/m.91600 type:complete len:217 (-) Transcript_38897:40-690(-)
MSVPNRTSSLTQPSASISTLAFLAPWRKIQDTFLERRVCSSSSGLSDIICSKVFNGRARCSSLPCAGLGSAPSSASPSFASASPPAVSTAAGASAAGSATGAETSAGGFSAEGSFLSSSTFFSAFSASYFLNASCNFLISGSSNPTLDCRKSSSESLALICSMLSNPLFMKGPTVNSLFCRNCTASTRALSSSADICCPPLTGGEILRLLSQTIIF